jgi:hypothetical protein
MASEMMLSRVAAIQASLAAAADDMEEENQVLHQEDEDDPVIEVERLQTLGIASSDVNRLKSAGMFTVQGVKMRSKKVRPGAISRWPLSLNPTPADVFTCPTASHGGQRNDRT